MMKAIGHQFISGKTLTEGSSFRRVADVFSAKVPMNQSSLLEPSYAFSIARTKLPRAMRQVGVNPGLMPGNKMPIVAQGTPSRLVLYHQVSYTLHFLKFT
jgi:hypothetical protein